MIQKTLFIADVHLDPKRPQVIAQFLSFLIQHARHAQALYILGDLFEVWVGDDEADPVYQPILKALRELTCPVWVMLGNRDFLLGAGFVDQTGCQLLSDPNVIDLYGTTTLLMHGDTLCTADTAYQQFRRQVRDPHWQQQFLAQPLAQRRLLAQQARQHSQAYTQTAVETIMDVSSAAVASALQEHQVGYLIHGHTHRPATHRFDLNGQWAYRHVLGCWSEQEAIILRCTADAWQLVNIL